jgi:hypothetical protein
MTIWQPLKSKRRKVEDHSRKQAAHEKKMEGANLDLDIKYKKAYIAAKDEGAGSLPCCRIEGIRDQVFKPTWRRHLK